MKKITIKFCDTDGYLLAKLKKDINKPFDEELGISPMVNISSTSRFLKWDKDIDSLTTDSIVTAVYETIPTYKFEEIEGKIYLSDTDCRAMNPFYDIPKEYAGKKVYGILPGAFKNVSANAASIYIPKTIKDIQKGAFDSCYNTTLLFETKEPVNPNIANFKANIYYGVTEKNHFIEDEFEYLFTKQGLIVLRCLDPDYATIVMDHLFLGDRTYDIIAVDPYCFYAPNCANLLDIYIPKNIDVEDLMMDYITNANIVRY